MYLSLRPETKKTEMILNKKNDILYFPNFFQWTENPCVAKMRKTSKFKKRKKKKEKKKEKIFQTISVITENRTRQKKCSFHLSSYQSLSSVKVSCLNQFFVIETHRKKLSKIFEISQRGQKFTKLKLITYMYM